MPASTTTAGVTSKYLMTGQGVAAGVKVAVGGRAVVELALAAAIWELFLISTLTARLLPSPVPAAATAAAAQAKRRALQANIFL